MSNSTLSLLSESPALTASAIPTVVLSRDLRVWALNRAYEQVSMRSREAVLGEEVFTAFPDNPQDPEGAGGAKLLASLEHVLTRKEQHNLGLLRYDITDPQDRNRYLPRVWSPVNSPILEHGRVIGVLQQVEDVSLLAFRQATEQLDSREQLARLAAALTNVTQRLGVSEEENDRLRMGLASNRVIGIAVGILMSRHQITREQAFELLRSRSQQSNRKVRDLAELIAGDVGLPPRS